MHPKSVLVNVESEISEVEVCFLKQVYHPSLDIRAILDFSVQHPEEEVIREASISVTMKPPFIEDLVCTVVVLYIRIGSIALTVAAVVIMAAIS